MSWEAHVERVENKELWRWHFPELTGRLDEWDAVVRQLAQERSYPEKRVLVARRALLASELLPELDAIGAGLIPIVRVPGCPGCIDGRCQP